jgi:hypothetical protein
LANFNPIINGKILVITVHKICNHNKGVFMKKKLLAVALIGVIMGVGIVLFGCDPLRTCPGGAAKVARGQCTSEYSATTYDQCTDKCITDQGTRQPNGLYTFNSRKYCTCN